MESPGATGSASHRFSFAVFVEADQSAICAGGHIRGGSMAAPEMPSAIRQKRALAFFGRFAGIERVDRVRSGEPQLPHMPDVKEPGFRARVEVLIEDAGGILHRHLEAGEGHHLLRQGRDGESGAGSA